MLANAHTWASLMKSAASSSEATMTIPTPPRNKRAFALKTTNLIKLLSFPMVAWHVHSHSCFCCPQPKASQPTSLSPWLSHVGRGAAVTLCYFRWWWWLLAGIRYPLFRVRGQEPKKDIFSTHRASIKVEQCNWVLSCPEKRRIQRRALLMHELHASRLWKPHDNRDLVNNLPGAQQELLCFVERDKSTGGTRKVIENSENRRFRKRFC